MFLNAQDLSAGHGLGLGAGSSAGLSAGESIERDVAIVGSGACGITLAHKLAEAGRDVVVLEAGGRQYEAGVQAQYGGIAEGHCLDSDNEYLSSSRLRYLGGTTNHWAGWCRPLDPLDLERRAELEHSGWPLSYDELSRYFAETEELLQLAPRLAPDADDFGDWTLSADSDVVERCLFRFSPPVRFRLKYDRELAESDRILVLLHASLARVQLDADGRRVVALEVATPDNSRIRVQARLVVLAMGAVENARMLLASDDVQTNGVGNDADLVGRFFMDHPHRRMGKVLLRNLPSNSRDYQRRKDVGQKRLSLLKLSSDFRRARRLAGASIQIVQPRRKGRPSEPARALAALDRLRGLPEPRRGPMEATLLIRGEQLPNPNSRVLLDEEVDRFGVRRARLDWQMLDEDLRTITATGEALGAELARTATGHFRSTVDPEDPWSGTVGGNHHIGTTRMASAADQGVVDSDCKVFGVENLYVGGSSVFPTSGYANPTYTIVALTLRLAEHLDRRLT